MRKILSSLVAFCATFLMSAALFAQDHAAAVAGAGVSDKGIFALAAGIAIGLAAFGGTSGQSRAAAAALEGIARNPGAASKVQTPMILGMALIESLVILAWVIAFMIVGKIAY